MAVGHSPMVRRSRLGAELRKLRRDKNLTIAQVSVLIGWQASELSRLENGKLRPDLSVVMDILDALECIGPEREMLISMARDANQRGWWKAMVGPMFERYRQIAEIEAGATEIRQITMLFVPGLLQTEEYARSRLSNTPGLTEASAVQTAINGRLTRQKLLDNEETQYSVLMDEGILHRRTCEPGMLADQFRHLLKIGQRSNIDIRIIPFVAEIYERTQITSGFTLFRYASPDDPRVAYVETSTVDLVLSDREDLARYEKMHEEFGAHALNAADSLALIEDAVERFQPKGT
ncbi:helix-turn-helix domain-containing protein [Longispora albida]|uniref:helix-turn-helix domain-containing protein n=1 Tax=Longispora albida TaxID=203523 RepID=UPI0003A5523B|nr:helix-turn-helix transcriptional regulator [Longispora albida]